MFFFVLTLISSFNTKYNPLNNPVDSILFSSSIVLVIHNLFWSLSGFEQIGHNSSNEKKRTLEDVRI